MNGTPLAEAEREAALVQDRVVSFRRCGRMAMLPPRRRPGFVPGVLIRLDERRIARQRLRRSSRIGWLFVGSWVTLLLLLGARLIVPARWLLAH